ncbi:hypothetical protein [Mariniblastus fucicola]|uniref:Uncharacterized protein n=1 Tax=Mariniblastus fucicola TaxID=980251 RepID=A0A5B9P6I3_9BACT|nr:hypothetical protein [Mariniblastus fucicola]QEG20612.1 hypothetical protein MFFC18_04620 [Mariniblastus fucicola]
MSNKLRTNQSSRRGVTLLFTISMIVLFLLMGTTFVVVANDYYKTATRRSRLNTYKVDATALLDRAFYEAFRGTSLDDTNSPLRGEGVLEDQYGYGYRAAITGVSAGPTSALRTLSFDITALTSIHDGSNFTTANYVDGLFNGQVLTIIGGAADGYSARIVSHAASDISFSGSTTIQAVIPRDNLGIDWTSATYSVAADVAAGNASIVINGRDFSGTGAGTVAGAGFFDRDSAASTTSLTHPLTPNHIGRDIYADYLQNPNSPNEDYDAPDVQNMFLSGLFYDTSGATAEFKVIPSFHRDSLYLNQQGTSPTADDIREFSFRPVYVADNASPPNVSVGSTANTEFANSVYKVDETIATNRKFNPDGTMLTTNRNDDDNLDVDNDNDGDNDSVWIDIGLPIQTDSQGRRFRPLVAYRIVDMDNRLNVNAHGSYMDQSLPVGTRRGSNYGVAEVSLKGILPDNEYLDLLNSRSGLGDPLAGNLANALGTNQKLFGYVGVNNTVGGFFSTTGDAFAQFVTETPGPYTNNSLPAFTTGPSGTASASASGSAYAADFSIGGGVGDSLFQAFEFERLLRPDDADSSLATFRPDDDWDNNGVEDEDLHEIDYISDNPDEFTTDSFEVSVPTSRLSIFELLRQRVSNNATLARALVDEFVTPGRGILSKELMMGGKFNLNRPFGNGVDNDGDGVVDNAAEASGETGMHGGLPFDLNNDGTIDSEPGIKQDMARHLYSLALLVCGDTVPPQLAGATPPFTADDYHRAVAQWAVNVVDFYDHDSKMTLFEYDRTPFADPSLDPAEVDGDPATPILSPTDGGVVIGVERPELLIMESMAFHSREVEDLDTDSSGNDRDGGDDDWDSRRKPISGAYFELYNPWKQAAGSRRFQNESLDPTGIGAINLAANIGGTPTWRFAIQRGKQRGVTPVPDIDDPDIIRTIYFTTPPTAAGLSVDNSGDGIDEFYPSTVVDTVIGPGDHMVIGSSGNIPGRNMTTFGRLVTGVDPDNTRSIELNGNISGTDYPVIVRDVVGASVTAMPVPATSLTGNCKAIAIDLPRSLSLSDPTGDYDISLSGGAWMNDPAGDGQVLNPAFVYDVPFDANLGLHRTDDDRDAIWTNGIYKDGGEYQFRIVHLQRLADPTLPWNANTNPYVTVDTANVDLLAYNGFLRNPSNGQLSSGTLFPENYSGGVVTDGSTELATVERAEGITSPEDARRTFFRTGTAATPLTADTGSAGSDGHTFSYNLSENLGTFSDLYDHDSPLGWLVWNDRPFANHMEIVHVPTGSPGKFLSRFNVERPVTAPAADADRHEQFSYYMGDPQFGHLIGFGSNPPDASGGGALYVNRFDRLLDFIEVPNPFIGSERFLPTSVPMTGALRFGLNAPFNSLPTFRSPGKININTINEQNVWNGLEGNFTGLDFRTEFLAERDRRDGATDFAGIFRSVAGAEYAISNNTASKGATSMYRIPDSGGTTPMFDVESSSFSHNTNNGSYFKNEFRQRLAATTTTRSSVFSIWITIGYFEVDEFGRVGAELGSDEGKVRRNRAFYMVDRSIPVACEPGKNHNVDNAVLVRTIIE